jgi:hypothetical protein
MAAARSSSNDDGARACASLVAEARAELAAGREPDWSRLQERILAAGSADVSRRALQQLDRLSAVHRARALVVREPEPPVRPPAPRSRAGFRTRPAITANMEVRRSAHDAQLTLTWDTTPAIVGWEVRVSRRPDARTDYAVQETRMLRGAETHLELPLEELPLRVHLLGRAANGRLVRRAVISGLTRDNWSDRWQRRASAS